jgi:methionyl-tRNA synthetase
MARRHISYLSNAAQSSSDINNMYTFILQVQNSADAAGKSPKVFADEVSATFRRLSDQLLCTYNRFIRTTDADHIEAAQVLWRKMENNGDIYLGAYEGWYSIRDEGSPQLMFLSL